MQHEALTAASCVKIFSETASGLLREHAVRVAATGPPSKRPRDQRIGPVLDVDVSDHLDPLGPDGTPAAQRHTRSGDPDQHGASIVHRHPQVSRKR
jgi:hypothetical protein